MQGNNRHEDVAYHLYHGGLAGKVFVDPIGDQPYVFLGAPTQDLSIRIQYVSKRRALSNEPRVVNLERHLAHLKYNPNSVSADTPPIRVLDE